MSLAKKLIPLLDRVLVEKVVPPAKSVGGVLLPESATQKVRERETCPNQSLSPSDVLHSLPPSLPHIQTKQILQGMVISTGKGRHANNGQVIPVSVQPGDKVLLPEYGGMPVKLDDKEYVVVMIVILV